MPKLSHLLCAVGGVSFFLGVWSAATVPGMVFTQHNTRSIVHGRLNKLIDRSQLSEDKIGSLDFYLNILVFIDEDWRTSHSKIYSKAVAGFFLLAACFFLGH